MPELTVTRTHDATGSHIEPPLDQSWDEPTKLAWHAAVIAHDTGITVQVHHHSNDRYGICIGDMSAGGQTIVGGHTYQSAWEFVGAVGIGAEAVIRVRGEQP
ncbi:hypothetical protein JBE04_02080 [Streptomyces sp. PRKS01-29]|nr:hypothetical protein [Streptomyces sabulosicollis]MBI0293317.1 hypothetical protein [Streptomyces sabulosicollis]